MVTETEMAMVTKTVTVMVTKTVTVMETVSRTVTVMEMDTETVMVTDSLPNTDLHLLNTVLQPMVMVSLTVLTEVMDLPPPSFTLTVNTVLLLLNMVLLALCPVLSTAETQKK
ncbi:hypothetical protein CBL_20735 [Carabus blaptoides fortunei]